MSYFQPQFFMMRMRPTSIPYLAKHVQLSTCEWQHITKKLQEAPFQWHAFTGTRFYACGDTRKEKHSWRHEKHSWLNSHFQYNAFQLETVDMFSWASLSDAVTKKCKCESSLMSAKTLIRLERSEPNPILCSLVHARWVAGPYSYTLPLRQWVLVCLSYRVPGQSTDPNQLVYYFVRQESGSAYFNSHRAINHKETINR